MTDTELFYHRKYLWAIIALRFIIIFVPLILRNIFIILGNYLASLCDFLEEKLPTPYILEKVPYEKLSKEEKRKPYKIQN